MSIKGARFCLFCHQGGITINFDTGNALRRHVLLRHPRTSEQKKEDRGKLRTYRRTILLQQQKLRST